MEEEIRVWNKPGNLCLPWKKKLGWLNIGSFGIIGKR
jgi:hypothetical protein